ncbi:hypothetical protein LAZ67_11002041 [Cordylochernes scorpioides]|uniref:Reverse transcriptase domain-containing protein n=1 Tax=Cordylochernes scorpioides TaxID=51811 RepID=A0ABY6KYX5_9ARAC|nr:hypothetical protein LAZ67_11002041 [Cordylochernes scorpioides]
MFGVLPPELSDHTTPYPDIDRARKIAHTRTQNKHLRDKNVYDQRHKQPRFEIGDLNGVRKWTRSPVVAPWKLKRYGLARTSRVILKGSLKVCVRKIVCENGIKLQLRMMRSVHLIDHVDQQRPYRVSPAERHVIQSEVEKMMETKIIRPSSSHWASPVILLRKKDGSLRFCVDYRRLNKITKKDVYPLPRIDDALGTLAGSRYFSTMDMRSGYWQIEV